MGMESPDIAARLMTPTGRFRVGRRLSPPQVPAKREGTMFALIPWDIWLAIVLCIATMFAAIFEPSLIVLLGAYSMLGAYIVVEIINDKKNI
jgi:general stress protein CsbA